MIINEIIYFCNEFELLEAHLIEHRPHVNKIFIAESGTTTSGIGKVRYFYANRDRFERYGVEYIQVPEVGRAPDWETFRVQDHFKNKFAHPIAKEGVDWVLHSDVDEIILSKNFTKIKLEDHWKAAAIKWLEFTPYINTPQNERTGYRFFKDEYLESPKGHPRGHASLDCIGCHFTNCFSTVDEIYWKLLNREWTLPEKKGSIQGINTSRKYCEEILKDPEKHKFLFGKEPLKHDICWDIPKWMIQNKKRFPVYV